MSTSAQDILTLWFGRCRAWFGRANSAGSRVGGEVTFGKLMADGGFPIFVAFLGFVLAAMHRIAPRV
jgi:hypothetical protein